MDTSDTSDFESADEFFSDTEEIPVKPKKELEINRTDNPSVGEEKPEDIQKPEECWEPGMDYDDKNDSKLTDHAIIDNIVEEMDKVHLKKEDNKVEEGDITAVPKKHIPEEIEMRIPPVPTTCWIPELHEANIKREPSNFIPGPPKFDRDGNPVFKKQDNDGTNLKVDQIETGKNPAVPHIRTTCWVPALNEANKKRRENEKFPPKPPTVDRDGNPIEYKIVLPKKIENPKENVPDEGNLWDIDETWRDNLKILKENVEKQNLQSSENNLWDNNDQWEVAELPPIDTKLSDTVSKTEDLWKDDFPAWGNLATPKNPQEPTNTSAKPESSLSSDDNMWENDQWESLEKDPEEMKPLGEAFDSITNQNPHQNQSWSNWGITSVLSTISQGLTSVIGVPEPEDLARQHLSQKEMSEDTSESGESFVGLGTLVSGVTKLVETTGTKVISGGLETLETIGKKTMEVLQENDPGLKKKRAFLKKIEPEKTVLSQVLREAKEQAEITAEKMEGYRKERPVDYEILFDDYQGLVHLEALSMISRQCAIKLNTISTHLSGAALTDLQETLDQVKELCELPTDDTTVDQSNTITSSEFNEATLAAIGDLNVPISFAVLLEAWDSLTVVDVDGEGAKGVYRRGVETLAKFTALAVEQMHKGGEMLLVKEHRRTVDEADSLVQISSMVISMLNTVTTVYTDKLNDLSTESNEDVNQYITNLFFEASNSTQYIQQAFQLLIPVLQVGAT